MVLQRDPVTKILHPLDITQRPPFLNETSPYGSLLPQTHRFDESVAYEVFQIALDARTSPGGGVDPRPLSRFDIAMMKQVIFPDREQTNDEINAGITALFKEVKALSPTVKEIVHRGYIEKGFRELSGYFWGVLFNEVVAKGGTYAALKYLDDPTVAVHTARLFGNVAQYLIMGEMSAPFSSAVLYGLSPLMPHSVRDLYSFPAKLPGGFSFWESAGAGNRNVVASMIAAIAAMFIVHQAMRLALKSEDDQIKNAFHEYNSGVRGSVFNCIPEGMFKELDKTIANFMNKGRSYLMWNPDSYRAHSAAIAPGTPAPPPTKIFDPRVTGLALALGTYAFAVGLPANIAGVFVTQRMVNSLNEKPVAAIAAMSLIAIASTANVAANAYKHGKGFSYQMMPGGTNPAFAKLAGAAATFAFAGGVTALMATLLASSPGAMTLCAAALTGRFVRDMVMEFGNNALAKPGKMKDNTPQNNEQKFGYLAATIHAVVFGALAYPMIIAPCSIVQSLNREKAGETIPHLFGNSGYLLALILQP
ncbi:MAG: hypothetical protein V4568_10665 [Pseudomonadota bacterium]